MADYFDFFFKSKCSQMAAEICRLIGSPRLKVLYDIYHMQINEGCICDTITNYGEQFGHIHVADAPGRHEPGTGDKGYVGYELFPLKDTETAVRAIMEEC